MFDHFSTLCTLGLKDWQFLTTIYSYAEIDISPIVVLEADLWYLFLVGIEMKQWP